MHQIGVFSVCISGIYFSVLFRIVHLFFFMIFGSILELDNRALVEGDDACVRSPAYSSNTWI
jgi:hypothetical protein